MVFTSIAVSGRAESNLNMLENIVVYSQFESNLNASQNIVVYSDYGIRSIWRQSERVKEYCYLDS